MKFQKKRHLFFVTMTTLLLSVGLSEALSRDNIIPSVVKDQAEEPHSPQDKEDISRMLENVVRIPELSEPYSFTPQEMNQIAPADPTTKINLIAPPFSNNEGSARLRYELEMPPARNNMTPKFQITYNSDRSSNQLGEGWEFEHSCIAIDTRSPLPNYSDTRTYDWDGMKIVAISSGSNKDSLPFYPIRNANHFQIVRYGRTPDKYTWTITDSRGHRYHYGALDANQILQKAIKGTIQGDSVAAQWKLSREEDEYGNYIEYTYKSKTETYQGTSTQTLYLDTVKIGNKGEIPHTIALFHHDQIKDSLISHNHYGFPLTSNHMLTKIEIKFEKEEEPENETEDKYETIRSYQFTYTNGHSKSDVLKTLTHCNAQGKAVSRHTFEYYDDTEKVKEAREYRDRTSNLSVDSFIVDRTNKLKTVHNPLGGCFTIDYSYSAPADTLGKPLLADTAKIDTLQADTIKGKLVMTALRINDGVFDDGENTKNEYTYYGGKCDTTTFLGFTQVITKNINTPADTIYRVQVKEYDMTNPRTLGTLRRIIQTTTDTTIKHKETLYDYHCYKISPQGTQFEFSTDTTNSTPETLFYIPLKYTKQHYPEQGIQEERYYQYHVEQGDFGEVKNIKYAENGTLGADGTGEYIKETQFDYHQETQKHIQGLPQKITVKGSDATQYLYLEANYSDPNNPARVTRLTQKTDKNNTIHTDFKYDKQGNMTERILPANAKGEKMTYQYQYDRRYNLYPERVENSFGYRTEKENYHYHYGIARTIRDRNGYIQERTIDPLGRIDTIRSANEQDSQKDYSIIFQYTTPQSAEKEDSCKQKEFNDTLILNVPQEIYTTQITEDIIRQIIAEIRQEEHPYNIGNGIEAPQTDTIPIDLDSYNICIQPWKYDTANIVVAYDTLTIPHCFCADIAVPAYALTRRYDNSNPTNDLQTLLFSDGFGRLIQRKDDGRIMETNPQAGTNTEQDIMIVSGREKYDPYGRKIAIYQPLTENQGTNNKFNPAFDQISPTTTKYDILDRLETIKNPVGDSITLSYSGESGLQKTILTDAEGAQRTLHTNLSGQIKKETHNSRTGEILTETDYQYDPLGRLITIRQGDSIQITQKYDMQGRLEQTSHPMYGQTHYQYDGAGNLISRQTSVLSNQQEKITFQYEYDRLISVTYPDYPENNITYTYGDKNASYNRVGQIALQQDATGVQEYEYGRQGEITKIRRTIIIPNQTIETYVTGWKYDTWNRPEEIIYPDGEKLEYQYNTGGHPESIKGGKAYSYDYVSKIGYNKYGERVYMKYCNGAQTYYTYNPERRFMENIQVWTKDSSNIRSQIMNDEYQYDRTGTNISNTSSLEGGTMYHHYEYNLSGYITYAIGIYYGPDYFTDGKNAGYSLLIRYNNQNQPLSLSKGFNQTDLLFDGSTSIGHEFTYQYEKGNPYRISKIKDNTYSTVRPTWQETHHYQYDANGNKTRIAIGRLTGNNPQTDTLLQANEERSMIYDQENQMLALSDNGYINSYWYDAGGERVIKMSGGNESIYVNSAPSGGHTQLSGYHVYINPYIEKDPDGRYIKHVHLGQEKIVSKIVDADSYGSDPRRIEKAGSDVDGVKIPYKEKYQEVQQSIRHRYQTLDVPYNATENAYSEGETLRSANVDKGNDNYEEQQYYYHLDNQGSTTLLTRLNGAITQKIIYTPFGELFINIQSGEWNTPYLFKGNIYDEETGLYLRENTYYNPARETLYIQDPWVKLYKQLFLTTEKTDIQ